MDEIIAKTTKYVEDYMSKYDASHDFSHIRRVLYGAKKIEAEERKARPDEVIDGDVVTLAALLHDVGDRKYLKPGEDASTLVHDYLISIGCDEQIASKVQLICTNVSYSNERKHPEEVATLCKKIPELAIVQDADRLDAIGAVGIARMFIYTGSKQSDRGLSVEHFHEKLLLLEGMMKTNSGNGMGSTGTQRMKEFLEWWEDEVESVPSDVFDILR